MTVRMPGLFPCLVGLLCAVAQAIYVVRLDGDAGLNEISDIPRLYPNFFLGALSCVALFAAGFLLAYPIARGLADGLVRSALAALLASFACFEFGYFVSRFPPITEVSLSLSLRPWWRILPMCLGTAVVVFPIFLGSYWFSESRSLR